MTHISGVGIGRMKCHEWTVMGDPSEEASVESDKFHFGHAEMERAMGQ